MCVRTHDYPVYNFCINLIVPCIFLSNFRYFLGSFFDSRQFQLLSGIKLKIKIRPNLYLPIYLSIIILTSTIAFVSANIKKMKERYKERKFHKNINVNLSEQQPYEGQLPSVNNVKKNVPIFNGFQIAIVVGFILAIMITFVSLDYAFNDSKHYYEQYVFKQFTAVFIYNIVIPLIYLILKKKMRKYFWKYVSDVMF